MTLIKGEIHCIIKLYSMFQATFITSLLIQFYEEVTEIVLLHFINDTCDKRQNKLTCKKPLTRLRREPRGDRAPSPHLGLSRLPDDPLPAARTSAVQACVIVFIPPLREPGHVAQHKWLTGQVSRSSTREDNM